MIIGFRDECDLLLQITDQIRNSRFIGDFDSVRSKLDPIIVADAGPSYRPIDDPLLLELHCIAASAYDHLGDYERARQFVWPWQSDIDWQVGLALKQDDATSPFGSTPYDIWLWRTRGWLLQRCAVVCYRSSNFRQARILLTAAEKLSVRLGKSPVRQEPAQQLSWECISASNYYWLGCVEIYANNFREAEDYFVKGLYTIEKLSRDSTLPLDHPALRFADYIHARILFGLGLERFHRGALGVAHADLLTARYLFQRVSKDNIRILRTEVLLLALQRIRHHSTEERLTELIEKLEEISAEFARLHCARHECRTQITIGLAKVNLSDIYRDRLEEDPEDSAAAEMRNRYLQEVRQIIATQMPNAGDSTADRLQLEILEVRVLRKLGELPEAEAKGERILKQDYTLDQVFYHLEALVGLAEVYFAQWKSHRRSDRLHEAEKLLEQALELGKGNWRSNAMCYLLLAQIALAREDELNARNYLDRCHNLEERIEYQWIRKRALAVEREIANHNVFSVSLDDLPESDVYKFVDRKLKAFLIRWASRGRSVEAAASKLGVTRQTVHAWQKDIASLNSSDD